MARDLMRLTSLFLRLYKFPALVWLAGQIAVLFIFRKVTVAGGENAVSEPSNTAVMACIGYLFTSFMLLLIFLGHRFSSAQRGTWLRQLPIRASSLNVLPFAIVFCNGLAMLLFVPWGAFDSGVSAFALGIPVAVFLVLKRASNFLFGLLQAALAGVLLIVFWLLFFWDWSTVHTQFEVETLALPLFTFIWLVLGGRERKYVMAPAAACLGVLIVATALSQYRRPSSFADAVLAHDFFPSERTLAEYRRLAKENDAWERVDQFDLPAFVNARSQEMALSLSEEEKITLIENVERNRMKWREERVSKRRHLHYAVYPQPELRLGGDTKYPIAGFDLQRESEQHLYANWRDSDFLCNTLPVRRTDAYLEKLFTSEGCVGQLFRQRVWTMAAESGGDFGRRFEQWLLDAHAKSPPKTKSYLMGFANGGWDLRQGGNKLKYDELRHVIFSQKPMNAELLKMVKADRFKNSLELLAQLPDDREGFLAALDETGMNDENPRVPLLYLCQQLFGDCNDFIVAKYSERISLLEAWRRRSKALSFEDGARWFALLVDELEDAKNWPRVQQLIEAAKTRTSG